MAAGDTIAALATAPGAAALGIIRLSGPQAPTVAERLFCPAGRGQVATFPSHTVHLGEIRDPETGEAVDQVLLTLFRAPRSYTGEEMAEIAAHGGPVVLRRILGLILSHGARLADPGEFTCRAFLNGKLDLAQAEAVNDLIQARTAPGLGIAVRQLEGRLSALVRDARDAILPLLSHIEATIDFPDDVPEMAPDEIFRQLDAAAASVARLLDGAGAGKVYRDGLRLVIAGRPNVGKSSILNALLREERAIVTDVPGTTRDVIEETANIGGIPLCAVDTAGIRAARDPAEEIGVQRAYAQLAAADLVLAVLDASQPLSESDEEILARAGEKRALIAANKSDLPSRLDGDALRRLAPGIPLVRISARTGEGMAELEARIAQSALDGKPADSASVLVCSARHQAALESAAISLRQARETLAASLPLELMTTDLRAALEALGQITGETVSDAVITDIFGRFCIGK